MLPLRAGLRLWLRAHPPTELVDLRLLPEELRRRLLEEEPLFRPELVQRPEVRLVFLVEVPMLEALLPLLRELEELLLEVTSLSLLDRAPPMVGLLHSREERDQQLAVLRRLSEEVLTQEEPLH